MNSIHVLIRGLVLPHANIHVDFVALFLHGGSKVRDVRCDLPYSNRMHRFPCKHCNLVGLLSPRNIVVLFQFRLIFRGHRIVVFRFYMRANVLSVNEREDLVDFQFQSVRVFRIHILQKISSINLCEELVDTLRLFDTLIKHWSHHHHPLNPLQFVSSPPCQREAQVPPSTASRAVLNGRKTKSTKEKRKTHQEENKKGTWSPSLLHTSCAHPQPNTANSLVVIVFLLPESRRVPNP
mmetsp:Transcript_8519/g.38055  ORF Transcript_8519/g.38055 Transcript_8519/m.38055 type:complete len:237 (+) Transcript_8519:2737-3447(+)